MKCYFYYVFVIFPPSHKYFGFNLCPCCSFCQTFRGNSGNPAQCHIQQIPIALLLEAITVEPAILIFCPISCCVTHLHNKNVKGIYITLLISDYVFAASVCLCVSISVFIFSLGKWYKLIRFG